MLKGIEVNYHSSVKIKKSKTIYIDPLKIDKNYNDADIILITHSHYDHFSEEDIKKIKNKDTVILVTEDIKERTLKIGFNALDIKTVKPNEKHIVKNVQIQTIPSYNINKKFHPKENNWVGYLITLEGITYYIAGDTDITKENKKVKCDVVLVPVGGTYTMNVKEAAKLINFIEPKIAIPIHYSDIAGNPQDGEEFGKLLKKSIECKMML